MGTLWQDFRYGLRMLVRNPGFTSVAMLTLALGIGATTAIFSVVDAVLLRPLPYKDPDRVVMVYNVVPKWQGVRINPSPADSLDWKAQNQVFSEMTILDWDFDPALSEGGEPVKVPGLRVSANFFSVFGVSPLLGRAFLPGEDEPGRDHVAVLSYGLWRTRFEANSSVIGKVIKLDDEGYTVVGVMPAEFAFRNNISNTDWSKDVALWAPNPFKVTPKTLRRYNWMAVIARLRPAVSLAQAQANMDAIADGLRRTYPDTNKDYYVKVQPLQEDLVREVQKPLVLLLAAVGLTLLIACVNVANLLLARATGRQKEIGIRVAIGASRARLIRQLLTESTLLSLVAGIGGVFLAWWGSRALVALSPSSLPRAETIHVDYRVLAFTLSISLFTGILFGMAPAIASSKTDLNQSLKEAGRSSGESLWGRRLRGLLVAGEIALSLMLLIAAGLAINSFFRLLRIDPGFDPRKVTAVELDLVRPRYADPTGLGSTGWARGVRLWTFRPRRWTFVRDVLERFQTLPEVESDAATDPRPPEGGSNYDVGFTIEGLPKPSDADKPDALYRPVTPDYFRTLRIPLLQGRTFSNVDDQQESQPVVIIDQAVARRYFPHGNPVGQHVSVRLTVNEKEKTFEIVGVVGAVRESGWQSENEGLAKEPPGVMYFPYFQQPQVYPDGQMYFVTKVSFLARTASNFSNLACSPQGDFRGGQRPANREDPDHGTNPLGLNFRSPFLCAVVWNFCRDCASARCGRDLCRHVLFRQRADTRNRPADGLGRRAKQRVPVGGRSRAGSYCGWSGLRGSGRHGLDPIPCQPALRDQSS
jgi:putative ABC transport system permease protein